MTRLHIVIADRVSMRAIVRRPRRCKAAGSAGGAATQPGSHPEPVRTTPRPLAAALQGRFQIEQPEDVGLRQAQLPRPSASEKMVSNNSRFSCKMRSMRSSIVSSIRKRSP